MKQLSLLLILVFGTAVAWGDTERVQILSINGDAAAPHAPIVNVHPGDVIHFTVDLLRTDNCPAPGCPENRKVFEFTWQANDRDTDRCDPMQDGECIDRSGFHIAEDGARFYVPYSMGREITLTVNHQASGSADSVILRNLNAEQPAPTQVVTSVSEYHYNVVEPGYALGGMGRWVWIAGVHYWVPRPYVGDWAPYQHGYWTWVNSDGWTWISYDPWGWYTDHYGAWRHHGVYGWIWLPFETPVYRPHVVTWFFSGGYVGWYPYYQGYPGAYRWGYEHGFDDGYWHGYHAGANYGPHYRYNPGLTMVLNAHLTNPNIYSVRATSALTYTHFGEAYRGGAYGPHPGNVPIGESRGWIENRVGRPVPITTLRTVNIGGATLHQPISIHPTPALYHTAATNHDFQRNIPIGPPAIPQARPAPIGAGKPAPIAQAVPRPEPRFEPRPAPRLEPRPETRMEPPPVPRPETRVQPPPVPRPETRVQPPPVPRPETRMEPAPVPRPETRVQSPPVPRPETRMEPPPVPRPETRVQPPPVPRPETRVQPPPVPRPETRVQSPPVPRPETRMEPRPAPRPEVRPVPPPQVARNETRPPEERFERPKRSGRPYRRSPRREF